jgi:hypothetical protein
MLCVSLHMHTEDDGLNNNDYDLYPGDSGSNLVWTPTILTEVIVVFLSPSRQLR